MSKAQFKINHQGVSELLKSQGIERIIDETGKKIAQSAGDDYVAETVIQKRAVCFVKPSSPKAYYSNLKYHTLENVIGGIGGKK